MGYVVLEETTWETSNLDLAIQGKKRQEQNYYPIDALAASIPGATFRLFALRTAK